MNDIKLAILRDVGLANNGYSSVSSTVINVRNAVQDSTLREVKANFLDLVAFGHLKLLGTDRGGQEFYCLPENFALVKMTLDDLTR